MYLPAGTGWYDLYTGEYYKGGQWMNAEAPYERMPVFIKEGSILPFGPDVQYTDEKPADTVHLFVYTGRNGSFTLYEDDGISYGYEKGRYSSIPLMYNESSRTLTIGERTGNYTGMRVQRWFNITWVHRQKPYPLKFDHANIIVKYSGEPLKVKMKE